MVRRIVLTMTGNHEQLATPLFKASALQVNQTPILNHLHYIISLALVNNLCYNKSMKGRTKMWYDTNKLKDLNGIKVIIITKRKRKKRNEKKHNEKL